MRKMIKGRAYGGLRLAAALLLLCAVSLPLTALAAAADEATLTVRQSFSGTGAPDSSFSYLLSPVTTGAPLPAGSTAAGYAFTVTGNWNASIGPITFPEKGVYTYVLSCTSPDRPGYTTDRRVYTIRVYVEKDTPSLTVTIHDGAGNKTTAAVFSHSYAGGNEPGSPVLPSDPDIMVDPPVVKTVQGTPPTASAFSFRLVPANAANPMPAGSVNGVKTVTVEGSGSAEFGTWRYTSAGTYRYTVHELDTGDPDYDYDTEVYTITDTVTVVNGQLVVSRVVTNGSNRQVSSMGFINTYTGTGTTPAPSPGDPDGPSPSPGGPTPAPTPGGPTPAPGGSNNGKPDGPKTGDDAPYAAYTVLFWLAAAAALASMALLLFWRKRKDTADPEA